MRINGKRASLTLLSAADVLRVRRETMHLSEADGAELSLRLDAALLALSLRSGGERLFSDGEAALQALSVGQIRRFTAQYEKLDEGARLEELRAPSPAEETRAQEKNESFDEARFVTLRAGTYRADVGAEQSAPTQSLTPTRPVAETAEESVYASVRPLSVQQLSQELERDARRYDGAFTLL